ncbi:DNA gyrase subunit A [bacterium]|nr:DNA gyrase subunit A [bacterium]
MALMKENIVPINVADEMQKSFLDYSMSVIISRALPDARDGLKPSQRRILYAMDGLGVQPNRKPVKCAKIVGETMGNFHPHGDMAIYPTLVGMGQWWGTRHLLIEGRGNFGSIDGDPPASMRYTEARLHHLGAALMNDMDRDTVDFVPTYDERLTEPVVLPAAFPNLIVNGGTGIAVGMATNIPPHNLGETIDAIVALIENPKLTAEQILKIMPGPDFPTGALICGKESIASYYKTGRGSLKLRGKVSVEDGRSGKSQLVITEVPYNVNPEELIKRVAELVEEKKLDGISDARNESDESIRIVLELKRDAIPKVVINNLYKHTALESSFGVIMLALDGRRPKLLPMREMLMCYLEHRREVVIRRTKFDLKVAEDRAHILEGYKKALDHLDDFVKIIRAAKDRLAAKEKLIAKYKLSDRQADAILELRLYQLTGLEREKIEEEYLAVIQKIEELRSILASEKKVYAIIKKELLDIKDKYADKRRTQIVKDEGEIDVEDLIAKEGALITLSHAGYIKRTSADSYRAQKRGGKGVIGMKSKEEKGDEEETDFVEHLFSATTHDYLMFFTSTGRVYVEKVYEIPEMGRTARGKSIANILALQPGEKIAALICVQEFTDKQHLVMATSSGIVKKTNLSDYANFRKGGIIGIKIEQGDELIGCALTNGKQEIVLVTAEGMSLRFHEDQLRDQGRATVGVYGIRPEKKDKVVGAAVVDPKATLLVVGDNGVGKRTSFDDYRSQTRGGKGIITMKTTDKTGLVAGAISVKDEDEIMLITVKGQMVRTKVKDIRESGRNTQGVYLVRLQKGDRLQGVARVVEPEEDDGQLELGT